jgi:hypothetical protein
MNTAEDVGRLFFPQSKGLGIDRSGYSPGVQQKIIYAGVNSSSFRQGSDHLRVLADLEVPQKQVQRLTRQIGSERVAERNNGVQAFQDLPLAEKHRTPAGVATPALAVVMVDGGRLQLRDVEAEEGAAVGVAATASAASVERQAQPDTSTPAATATTGVEAAAVADGSKPTRERGGKHWREDRVALLLTMKSSAQAADPCPQIPESFVDPTRILKLSRELKPVPCGAEAVAEAPADEPDAPELVPESATYTPPEVVERRVAASRENWWDFGPQVAQAARGMGLLGAQRKAFVGDGAENNWTLQQRFFGSFVAILDFIHALSYVFAAALAGRPFPEGWPIYVRWIGWVWEGQVERMIAELAQRQAELGTPAKGESETSPRSVVSQALTYLQNHKDKMRYDAYRREGLPITSSLMESLMKQINQRVKGSEKFWIEEGAEAVLQLRADVLSDDQPLESFWQRRQDRQTGQRRYQRAA